MVTPTLGAALKALPAVCRQEHSVGHSGLTPRTGVSALGPRLKACRVSLNLFPKLITEKIFLRAVPTI